MDSTIRRTLWGAFFVLTLLVAIALGLTVSVMQIGRRQESRIVHGSEPLRDAVQTEARVQLPQLSMGMSGDYTVAIEEGATLVRVGTAIFGERRGKAAAA